MDKKKGYYAGTEISEKWWKRFSKEGFFMRGNGEFWLDEKGLYFLRYLTKKPFFIPFPLMRELKLGGWHAGRWGSGLCFIKIIWEKDGMNLSSGFIISRGKEGTEQFKQFLETKISGK